MTTSTTIDIYRISCDRDGHCCTTPEFTSPWHGDLTEEQASDAVEELQLDADNADQDDDSEGMLAGVHYEAVLDRTVTVSLDIDSVERAAWEDDSEQDAEWPCEYGFSVNVTIDGATYQVGGLVGVPGHLQGTARACGSDRGLVSYTESDPSDLEAVPELYRAAVRELLVENAAKLYREVYPD